MQVRELGHVVLYVRDLERSRRFYRDLLGWREIGMGERSVAFSAGRTHHELLLIGVGEDAASLPVGRRVGMHHLGVKVGTNDEDLRLAVAELLEAGVVILGMTDHGVSHSVYFADPDGHEIEIYIDVQPEVWRERPGAVMEGTAPLQL